jgi:hypothetical protein
MSFHSAVQFPDVFLLDRIVGEEPLDVYAISITEVLTPSELADKSIQKDYHLERIDLNSKLIEAGITSEVVPSVFDELDKKGRIMDVREFVQILTRKGIPRDAIVTLLRGLKIVDIIITRVFAYSGQGGT